MITRHWVDRVAIVTGATKGIGRATAEALVERGCRVVVVARKPAEVDETVAALGGEHATGCVANVRDEDSARAIVAAAVERFGRIDFVVNNAGANASYGSLLDITRDAFLATVTVNAWAPLALVQAAVGAGLGDHPGAAVVNISTIGARQVQPAVAGYTASKAALDVLTRGLARELGPQGIRVNGLSPGLVQTSMAGVLWEGDRGREEAEILPLQRLGRPEDIAGAVAFLLSDEARWMTGGMLDVDGGRLLIGGEPRNLMGQFDLTLDPVVAAATR
ncbi:MAG: 3-oxoacyl-ACP reductase [Nocardioides sp.]|nr:3-oxoacyl-ACP reductase [Nocardioides sp.]